MISSITLRNVASYGNESVQIKDLKKVNFFFGYNGSGKSTLAKYLYDINLLENESDRRFVYCSNVGYDHEVHHLLVFDEKFIERNFISKNVQSGIFSLNEKNDAIDALISNEEEYVKTLDKYLNEELSNREAAIKLDQSQRYDELKKKCFGDRSQFKSFSKFKLKYSGSSENHFNELINILEGGRLRNINYNSLNDIYRKLYEKDLVAVGVFILPNLYKAVRQVEEAINVLLKEVIIGKEDVEISKIIGQLDSRNWVEDGYANYVNSEVCPFCQQNTLTQDLINQFDSLFNEAYKEKISTLKSLKLKYENSFAKIIEKTLEIQNVYNENNITSNLYLSLKGLFDQNIQILEDKLLHPNEKKKLEQIFKFKCDISSVNGLIRQNDELISGLDQEKEKLEDDIWIYLASLSKNEIELFSLRKLKYGRIVKMISLLKDRTIVQSINSRSKIAEWRQQTISTEKAVYNINIILKNTGFDNFEIIEKDEKVNNISQYYLKRTDDENDHVFKTLSEGEKNFIAFLYFYQQCLGVGSIDTSSKNKIIVIDDPVSSMDSKVLFIISTLIRQLIISKGKNRTDKKEFKNNNIQQVFILTHNIYFYKEVSFATRICNDLSHFHVNKLNKVTLVSLVEDKFVKNDYSLLWDGIMNIKNAGVNNDKSNNIFIANSMRRILETYVNFLGLGKSDWDSVSNIDETDPLFILYSSFLSFINDSSHKVSPLDDVYYQNIINQDPNNLFKVFELVFNEIGKDHYDYMVSA